MVDIATLALGMKYQEADKAAKSLDKLSKSAHKADTANDNLTKSTKGAARAQTGLSKSADKSRASLNRLSGALGAVAKAAGAALVIGGALAFRKFTNNTIEAQDAVAQLEQTLKSTGGVAGYTSAQLQKMAAGMQKVTKFGDESIVGAESLLLTFTKIGGSVFPKALTAILDVSTAMKQDLKTSVIQIGKALNDPILGMTALSRTGITFTQTQKDMVKSMVKSGNVIGAQTLILKELETQFGGSARAARETFGGSLKALGNAWGDLFELSKGATSGLQSSILGLTDAISDPAFVSFVNTIGTALFGAASLAVGGISMLVDSMSTLLKIVGALGAGLMVAFGPAIIATIGAFSTAIWTGAVTAVNGLTAAVAANPLGALAVAFTVLITAAYLFRDEIADVIGKDTVQIMKDGANKTIGAFVGAYEGVVATWGQLPMAFADLTLQAVNGMIAGLNKMIRASIESISTLKEMVGGDAIDSSGFMIGNISNPASGKASGVLSTIQKSIKAAQSRDYIGSASDAISRKFSTKPPAIPTIPANDNFQLPGATKAATKSLDAFNGKLAETKDKYADLNNVAQGFFSNMINGLKGGAKFWDVFRDAGLNALNSIFTSSMNAAFSGENGGISGILKSIFGGGGGSGAINFAGLYANGGNIPAGSFGITGERGPEIVTGPANITPMNKVGGQAVNINITNNAGVEVQTKQTRNQDGSMDIDFVLQKKLEAMLPGELDKTMPAQFGMHRAKVRRG